MSDTDRPNVLFVFTDQQSADVMRCAGNDHLDTPAMDRLAATGTRFERAYCANPVCLPSRTSLLTGRFPSAVGVRTNDHSHLDAVPEDITRRGLGHVARDAGYETAYGGKVHLPKMTPGDLGFEQLTTDPRDDLAEACVEFIERDSDDPFFLTASFINPHDICYMAIRDYRDVDPDYEGPRDPEAEAALDEALARPPGVDREEFVDEYCPPLPANYEPQDDEPEAVRASLDRAGFRAHVRDEWSDRRWREHRHAYARLTERVDAQVGRLLDALEATGQREDTVVIFTSDHGDMDAAHRMEHKGVLYEEAVNVPLIVSHPGETPGDAVDDHLVSNGLDVLPTVCDYAGVDPPADLDGRSLRPLAAGRSPDDWRDHVRVECGIGEGIVTDRYKYALYDEGANREQLYDLRDDPGETRNHAADPGNEAVVADLRERLLAGSALRS